MSVKQIIIGTLFVLVLSGCAVTLILNDESDADPPRDDSGTCGSKAYYEFKADTGTLTIGGTGKVQFTSNYAPWHSYASAVKTAVVGDGITEIGDRTFYNCYFMTSVSIPDSVTRIGKSAFRDCEDLTSVVIPDSVTVIDNMAFYNCRNLDTVVIGKLVESVGNESFRDCVSLTGVDFPSSLKSFGSWTFMGCTGLTSVVIPDSVKDLGSSTFENCTGLTSVSLGKSVRQIGLRVFAGCTGLTSVDIPEQVYSIYSKTFMGCTGLKSVVVPDSVIYLGDGVFKDCTGLTSVTIGSGIEAILGNTFEGCTGLTAVDIPRSVRDVREYAFSGCTGLTSVDIPDSVRSIGKSAFAGCTGLKSVTVPRSVTVISESMFENCENLTSAVIPDTVTEIKENAFWGCTGLTSIDIPDSVKTVEYQAFAGCSGVKSVSVGNSVENIGYRAFGGLEFYSYDGETELSPTVGYLRGSVFEGTHDRLVKIKTAVVSFDANGGSGQMFPESVKSSRGYTLPECVFAAPEHKHFVGWAYESDGKVIEESEITVDGDVTLYAVWVSDWYTVAFVNGTETVKSEVLEYGTVIEAPESIPTKDSDAGYSYVFDGWDGFEEGMTAAENTVFPAVYDRTVNQYGYEINYLDSDRNPIGYPVGGKADYGTVIDVAVPDIEGYVTPAPISLKITEDVSANVVDCIYETEFYSLVFVDGISEDYIVEYTRFDEWLEEPDPTEKKGCTAEWEPYGLEYVKGQIVNAVYTYMQYSVVFMNGDTVFLEKTMVYGTVIEVPAESPFKKGNAKYSYEFREWKGFKKGMTVEDDTVFEADYTEKPNSYTIRFVNGTETVKSEVLKYGTVIEAPENEPVRDSDVQYTYVFKEWKGFKEGMTVDGNETFEALYKKTLNRYAYTVEYLGPDGKPIDGTEIREADYGTEVEVKSGDRDIEGYVFSESGKLIVSENESENVVVCRYVFEIYSIVFKDGISEDRTVEYNILSESVAEPEITEKPGHISEWSDYELEYETGQVVEAVYTAMVYEIVFDFGGRTETYVICYGEPIFPPSEIPVKAEDENFVYEFREWGGFTEGMKATGNAVFAAVFDNIVKLPEPDGSDDYVIDGSDGTSAEFESEDLGTIAEYAKSHPDVSMEVRFGNAVLVFDNAALREIVADEDAVLSVVEVDKSGIGPEYHLKCDGNTLVYGISFGSNSAFGNGTVTVTLSYELKSGLNPEHLKVLYLSDGNDPAEFGCVYENGTVTFVTNHFSMYAVVYDGSSGETSVTVVLGAVFAAAVVIAAVVATVCVRKSA